MVKDAVVKFHFQEVPIEEVRNLVLAGSGKYSEVKSHLLAVLPTLAPDKAFVFGLPGGKEIPEVSRKGISMSVSKALARAGVRWKVVYSAAKRLFVCVPMELKGVAGAGKKKPSVAHNGDEPSVGIPSGLSPHMSLDDLLAIARKTFKRKYFKGNKGDSRIHRKALCVLGVRLGINTKELGAAVGLTREGVWFNGTHSPTLRGAKAIEELSRAVKGGS